jgi:hypothetical protein
MSADWESVAHCEPVGELVSVFTNTYMTPRYPVWSKDTGVTVGCFVKQEGRTFWVIGDWYEAPITHWIDTKGPKR